MKLETELKEVTQQKQQLDTLQAHKTLIGA